MPTSGRLPPRMRVNGARRWNKRRNVSWQDGSLQRKSGRDYKYNSMLKRDGKTRQRIAQSQRARVNLLAKVDQPLVVRIGILCSDVVLSFSGVIFFFFLSRFRLSCFKQKRGSSFNRSTVMHAPLKPHAVP